MEYGCFLMKELKKRPKANGVIPRAGHEEQVALRVAQHARSGVLLGLRRV